MFATGTKFSVILARYLFDQRLRSHLMEAFSFIMQVIAPNGDWANRLVALKDNDQSRVPETLMGFPPNWKAMTLWQKHL